MNKITALNILAIAFLLYSFRIVKWLRKENEKMDQTMKNSLTVKEGIHHRKADCSRLHAKRQNSGRELVKLDSACNAVIVGLSKYIKWGKDRFTRLVQEYDGRKAKYTLQKKLLL
jgi:hypothetical protein